MDTNVVHLKLVFLLFFPCLWTPHTAKWVYVPSARISPTATSDSLNHGDTLNSSNYIVFAKRKFALGFFHRRIDNTTNKSYLAIVEIADQSRPYNLFVWFGSGSNAIVNNSGMFTLDGKGTMKIVQQGDDPTPTVLYSSPKPTKNIVATLLDSGNFILKELHSKGTMKWVLWQSFDYPFDILLPRMKLGVSHKTGKTWSLTSWSTELIPDPGPFSLEWYPKGYQLIIQRRGEVYWSSGALMGGKVFKNISPNVTSMYDFVIVSNEDEEYFNFSKRNQSLVSEWLLSPMGQLKDLKGEDIARADNCDGYNTNGGCQIWKQPMCRVVHPTHLTDETDSIQYNPTPRVDIL